MTKRNYEYMSEQEIRGTYSREIEQRPEQNLAQLACALGRIRPDLNPYVVALDAGKLFGLAKQMAALSVAACNYELSARQETRRKNLEHRAQRIASFYSLCGTYHGDPRGYTVRLHGAGLPQNGIGEGFGVA